MLVTKTVRCWYVLVPGLIGKGVVSLEYENDTIMCISRDLEKSLNLKLMFYILNSCLVKNEFIEGV